MKEGDNKSNLVVTRGCIVKELGGEVVDPYLVELSPSFIWQVGILEGDIIAREEGTSVVVERARLHVEEGGLIGKQQGGTDQTDDDAAAKLDRRSDATGRWLDGQHLLLGGVEEGSSSLEVVDVTTSSIHH